MKFKYELIKMNVVKVTNDDNTRDILIAQGFKLMQNKEEEPSKDSISQLTVDKLKDIAKEKGLDGYSKLSKDELIKLIKEN